MTGRAILVVVVALVACGRVRFDARAADGGADAMTCVGGSCNCNLQVSVGASHTCVRLDDDTVRCFGANTFGEIGTLETTATEPVPRFTSAVTGIAIAAGRHFTCGIQSGQFPACFGENSDRQLDGVSGGSPQLQALPANTGTIVSMSSGAAHSCALTTANTAVCWGDADEGEAGTGSDPDNHPPELVPSLGTLRSLSAGTDHVCAALTDGTVRCWGAAGGNRLGQNGVDTCATASAGSISCSKTPQSVPAVTGAVGVAAGHAHSCAWLGSGDVLCWGANASGEAGQAPASSAAPGPAVALANVVSVTAGRAFTCALDGDGAVWCWGNSAVHQLGSGTAASSTPVRVPLPGPASAVDTNPLSSHACAVLVDRTLQCWGANDVGQLGRGTTTPRELPAEVPVYCP